MNPNETRGTSIDDVEEEGTENPVCPVCNMERDEWTGNQGQGVMKDDQTYCCRGCAEGTGCVCSSEAAKRASFTSSNRERGTR